MKDLDRFLEAKQNDYETALSEMKLGRKRSHWMWYIFPQIAGLGFSKMSRYYAITDLEEAKEYLEHPILGARLKEISQSLLDLDSDAHAIFGSPDDLKLHSSMTVFAYMEPDDNSIFIKVLEKFFDGELDLNTMRIIG